jgi:glutaredoxin 3
MKKVSIYTTPTCVYCKSAKEFFKEHNVPYNEYNVAADAEKRQEMIEMTGHMGVPVIMVDDQVIIGFDKPKLAQALGV